MRLLNLTPEADASSNTLSPFNPALIRRISLLGNKDFSDGSLILIFISSALLRT